MRRSTLAVIIVIILLIIGAAIALTHKSNNPTSTGTNTSSNSSTQSNQTSTASVDIKNMMFTPSQVTVAKGATVTWTNDDSVAHTVTADINNTFDSGAIDPGKTFSYTFNTAGSYQYHCSIHSSMRGTIVVR